MAAKSYGQLTVQADMRYAGLVLDVVREVAAPARLPEKQAKNLALAVKEAYANAVEHAYPQGAGGPVTVSVELAEERLLVSVKDRGMPFAASLEPAEAAAPAGDDSQARGLRLIRSVMDEVRWASLGTEGKEFRMTLNLRPGLPDSPGEVPAPAKERTASPAPPQTYTHRLIRPEDAIGVARCFFEAYGYSYPSAYLYDPEKIVELNKAGKLISVVAVSDLTGEVAAHCSVQRYDSRPYGECGQLVIARAHQGRIIKAEVAEFIEQESLRAGLRRLLTHEVTSHPVSQRATRASGFKPCALALGAMPASMSFRKMADTLPQRESCVVSMKFLVPPEAAVVCAPQHHQRMIERLYDFIGRPVGFESLPPPAGPGETAIVFNRAWGIADIQVRRLGTDTAADVSRRLRDLLEIGHAQVVYLELPLDQGGIDDICRTAEREGFIFAGLSPSSVNDGESLFLQYLNAEIDMSYLRVATSMGKELFDYVASERQRLQR